MLGSQSESEVFFLISYLGKVQKLNLLISTWGEALSSIPFVLSSQNDLLC